MMAGGVGSTSLQAWSVCSPHPDIVNHSMMEAYIRQETSQMGMYGSGYPYMQRSLSLLESRKHKKGSQSDKWIVLPCQQSW